MFTMAIRTCSYFLVIFGNTFLFTKYFYFFYFSIIFYELSSTKIGLMAMDRKRCFEKRAETSEGKTIILQAEFDEFGTRVPDEVGGGDWWLTFFVIIGG